MRPGAWPVQPSSILLPFSGVCLQWSGTQAAPVWGYGSSSESQCWPFAHSWASLSLFHLMYLMVIGKFYALETPGT